MSLYRQRQSLSQNLLKQEAAEAEAEAEDVVIEVVEGVVMKEKMNILKKKTTKKMTVVPNAGVDLTEEEETVAEAKEVTAAEEKIRPSTVKKLARMKVNKKQRIQALKSELSTSPELQKELKKRCECVV